MQPDGRTKAATRRNTYGFGRADDLAGLFVVAMIDLRERIIGRGSCRHPLVVDPLRFGGSVVELGGDPRRASL